jgi:hypothetical protein
MRFCRMIVMVSLCAAAGNAQLVWTSGVAQRVEELTKDVASLKVQNLWGTALTGNTGGPVEVKSGANIVASLKSDDDGGILRINDSGGKSAISAWVTGGKGVLNLYGKVPTPQPRKRSNLFGLGDENPLGGRWELIPVPLVTLGSDDAGTSGRISVGGPSPQITVGARSLDYAEVFDVADRGGMGPGSVVAETETGRGLVLAAGAYNSAVVGVIAGAGGLHSGMVIGTREDGTSDLPVATGGQVFVRVCPESGNIKVGDLLVSSSIPGVAMRGSDSQRLTGTVIGKALQAYSGQGEGLIRMLVLNR